MCKKWKGIIFILKSWGILHADAQKKRSRLRADARREDAE